MKVHLPFYKKVVVLKYVSLIINGYLFSEGVV